MKSSSDVLLMEVVNREHSCICDGLLHVFTDVDVVSGPTFGKSFNTCMPETCLFLTAEASEGALTTTNRLGEEMSNSCYSNLLIL
jgi:hypothetical protein